MKVAGFIPPESKPAVFFHGTRIYDFAGRRGRPAAQDVKTRRFDSGHDWPIA
jgi:hypothetical protein